ncbi:MAG: MFS transporter [Verrucomicrobiota bacterium]
MGYAAVTGLRDKILDAGRSLRSVFANPGLRRLELAFTGSIVGDWAYAVAVALYAFEHGGPTAVGVLGVARYISLAIVTPFASTLGDRYSRRLVMVASDTTRAVLVAAAAVLIWSDGPSIAVYTLAIVTAVCGSPFRSSQAALLPQLARDPIELAAANVASSTVESIGFFAGPALAGLMLAVTSIPVVYVFNAVTFLWSAALVLGVRLPPKRDESPGEEKQEAPEKESFLAEASAGYRTILGDRNLRLLVGLYCGQTVVAGASLVFTVTIALDLLDLGRSGLGYINATLGIGGLVGGFVALVLAQRGKLARDFGIGVALWSAPLLLVAAWPTIGTTVAVMCLLGLANSVVDVNAYTILQRIIPEGTMARVFGAMESAVIGGMALGALAMPALINTIGLRWGLVVIGSGVTVLVVVGLPGLRRIDLVIEPPSSLGLLRGVPLLALLPEPTLEALARSAVRVEAEPGEVVIREGEPGDLFYVIESGQVEVTKDGRHVATLGPGDYVGEIALLRDVPRTATVTATTAAVFQALDRATFVPAVTGQGEFQEAADTAMATRLAML